MLNDPRPPAALATAIRRDLHAVRPLRPAWLRALVLLPLAILVLLGLPVWVGLRIDSTLLGPGILWGLSLLQLAVGIALASAALLDAVPGSRLSDRWWIALLALPAACMITVTAWTRSVSLRAIPTGLELEYALICTALPVLLGLPLLAIGLVLAIRTLPRQPMLTGLLLGFSCGLMIDAAWRTFCEVSTYGHVLRTHAGSVTILALLGVLGGWIWNRFERRRFRRDLVA